MDMDRLDRAHRTHSYSRRSHTYQWNHWLPSPRERRSSGRSVERSVVVPAEAEAEDLVVVVRTRRRFAPAMSATAQFSSSAITGCVFARREPRLVIARSSFPNPIDRLDRIRARGKIRARMDAFGRMMAFVRKRVRLDR